MKQIYIGIDPDVTKSGVAVFTDKKLSLYNKDYFELFDFLANFTINDWKLLVVIEKGQANKHLFNAIGNKNVANNISMNIGRNFEATNIIEKFCKRHSINYEFYVPKMQKLNQIQIQKLFPYIEKSNEEQRDAIRCILRYIL